MNATFTTADEYDTVRQETVRTQTAISTVTTAEVQQLLIVVSVR